jgi:hypothetical protein
MANKDTTHGYAHSNYARKIASSLAIATFNRVTKTMKSKLDSNQTLFWKEDIGSFVLKAEDGKSVEGFK